MIGDGVALRGEGLDPGGAAVEIEHFVAAEAVEMVVMVSRGVGGFVARWLAWEVDGGDLSLIHEIGDQAIDGGEAQRGNVLGCQFVQLVHGKGTSCGLHGLADRSELLGVPHSDSL